MVTQTGTATATPQQGTNTDVTAELSGAAGIPSFPAAAAPSNGVSIAEVIRIIYDAQQGAAGLATYPSGAAAANAVSMAEVLRYAQENIINTTGTVMPVATSLFGILAGASGVTTYPSAAAPANAVSIAAVLKWINDALQGANGVVTYPAAAAPTNGVSMAEVLSANYSLLAPVVATGTIAIVDASQTETTPFSILTITPAAGAPLADVEVWLDLKKASTGFGVVETAVTVLFQVARKIDGTNYRAEVAPEAALSGTTAAVGPGRMAKLTLGAVTVTELAKIYATFSADITGNIDIPYAVVYKGIAAPTIA